MYNFIIKITNGYSPDSESEKVFKGKYDWTSVDLQKTIDYIWTIIEVAVNIAGVVALVMMFYATILYVTSYGDDAKIETAKKTLLWSIIGLAFIALSRTIIGLIHRDIIN